MHRSRNASFSWPFLADSFTISEKPPRSRFTQNVIKQKMRRKEDGDIRIKDWRFKGFCSAAELILSLSAHIVRPNNNKKISCRKFLKSPNWDKQHLPYTANCFRKGGSVLTFSVVLIKTPTETPVLAFCRANRAYSPITQPFKGTAVQDLQ